jgi:hypothetical protein
MRGTSVMSHLQRTFVELAATLVRQSRTRTLTELPPEDYATTWSEARGGCYVRDVLADATQANVTRCTQAQRSEKGWFIA